MYVFVCKKNVKNKIIDMLLFKFAFVVYNLGSLHDACELRMKNKNSFS